MKYFRTSVLFVLLWGGGIFAQEKNKNNDKMSIVIEKGKYQKVDKMAFYPDGGENGFRRRLMERFRLYDVNQYEGITGEEMKTYNYIKNKMQDKENPLVPSKEDKVLIQKIEQRDELITILTFVIENNGKMTNIKAEGENESLNNEVVRAVKSIDEKWNPALKGGKPMASKYKIPFRIKYQ